MNPTTTKPEPSLLDQPTAIPAAPGTAVEVAKPVGPLAAFHENDEYGNWGDVDDGLIGMEHIGYQMPRLIPDMRPGGGWKNEVTGEKLDQLDIVWLTSAPGRAWWEDPFDGSQNPPDCRSADMDTPDPQSPKPQATKCAACPRAQWVDGSQACSTRLNILAYDVTNQSLVRTSIGPTSLKWARSYLSALKSLVPPRKPMSQVTHVTLIEAEGKGRRWLEAQFTPGERINRADAEPLIRLQQEMSAQWRSMIADDLARPDTDQAGDPFPAGTVTEAPTGPTTASGHTPFNAADEQPF